MKFEEGNDKGKKFEKGNKSGKGKPPKNLTLFKQQGYSKQDFTNSVSYLFWADMDELKLIDSSGEFEGNKVPSVVKLLVGVIIESVQKKTLDKVKDLLKYIAPSDDESGLSSQISEIVVRLGGDGVRRDPPIDPLAYSMGSDE